MSSDYTRWIYNPTYNEAKRRDEQLAQERRRADQKVNEAKQRLNYIENEISNQTSLDRKELDFKLARERERLLEGLDTLDESVRLEFGRQNMRFREQLDAVRMDMGRVNVRVSQVGQRIDELADQFNSNINSILSRVENQKDRARAYSNQLRLLLEHIAELHPDKLTPGEYELLSEGLTYAESDAINGDYEAAIGVAQTHIPVAAELRTRLEVLNDEFSQLVVQIHNHCNEVYSRIQEFRITERNQQVLSFKDTEEVEFDGRIPFWSNGIFEEIVDRFEQICDDIENNYEISMDIESLRRALGDILVINRNLDECISFAHSEYLEFVGVQSLVRRIHETLTFDDVWHIIDSGFADDDERRSYSLSYENGAGLKVTFVIMPTRDVVRRNRNGSVEYGETQFRIDVFQVGNNQDEQLCNLTRSGILAQLIDGGIDVGNNGNLQAATTNNSDEFISTIVMAGDKIKDGRIAAVKDRVGL